MEVFEVKKKFLKEIEKVNSFKELEEIKLNYLGRKSGILTKILHSLKNLPIEKRKKIGKEANSLKKEIENLISLKFEKLKAKEEKEKLLKEKVDLTCPGKKVYLGHLHPLTLVLREIKDIFLRMGFEIVEGPEIENSFYNFDALNIPQNHPARDLWSTLWLDCGSSKTSQLLLRTHTSPVQVRYMEKHQPPFRIIAPGRVFRHKPFLVPIAVSCSAHTGRVAGSGALSDFMDCHSQKATPIRSIRPLNTKRPFLWFRNGR